MEWIDRTSLSMAVGWTSGVCRVQRLAWRGTGQSTVEYALVGALVVIAAAGALTLLGGELNTVFTNISKTLQTAAASH